MMTKISQITHNPSTLNNASYSNEKHQRMNMPGNTGTTNMFLSDVAAFVVPPSGGCAHDQNRK